MDNKRLYKSFFLLLGIFFCRECQTMWRHNSYMPYAPPSMPANDGGMTMMVAQARVCCVPVYAVRGTENVSVAHVLADVTSSSRPCIRFAGGRPSPITVGGEPCFSLPAIESTDEGFSPIQIFARMSGDGQWIIPSPTDQEISFARSRLPYRDGASESRPDACACTEQDDSTSPTHDDALSASSSMPVHDQESGNEPTSWLLCCPLCWRQMDEPVRPAPDCRLCLSCRQCAEKEGEIECSLCPKHVAGRKSVSPVSGDDVQTVQPHGIFRSLAARRAQMRHEVTRHTPSSQTPSPLCVGASPFGPRIWRCGD